jgi:hypothetical protein
MNEKIKVGHGGADGSCKHIKVKGTEMKLQDLLQALCEAKEKEIRKVCISSGQFDSPIESIGWWLK